MQPILIPLSDYLTDVVIQGSNALAFLQGQLTCDISLLGNTRSSLGAHCDLKGRVVSLCRVYHHLGHWRLTVPTSAANIAIKALQHYARFSKITLEQHSPERYGLLGESIPPLLSTIGLPTIATPNEVASTHTITLIRHLGAQPRFELIGELPAALSVLSTATVQEWQAAQIQAGEVWINEHNSSLFLPHELNLPALGAVSFQKGCYLGQEIIARMEYRGKLKKQLQLVPLLSTDSREPGSPYQSPSCKGHIVCSADHTALVVGVFSEHA